VDHKVGLHIVRSLGHLIVGLLCWITHSKVAEGELIVDPTVCQLVDMPCHASGGSDTTEANKAGFLLYGRKV
jgi:hypothetical protein